MNISETNAVKDFFSRLSDERTWLENDIVWSKIAEEILIDKNDDFRGVFWHELERIFIEKEENIGEIHKGEIYWRLAIFYLSKGNISKSISYLDNACIQDKKRGDEKSAAIYLSSILKPMLVRFKNNSGKWQFDEDIKNFYNSLSGDEKRKFALNLGLTHDIIVNSQITVINDDYFDFIVDIRIRKIVKELYDEIKVIISHGNLKSYYSCIFNIGSIVEGILDDLFQRDDMKVWKLFEGNMKIKDKIGNDSRLNSKLYMPDMTLGQKIKALRFMSEVGLLALSRISILDMLIIDEYRSLIHPRRKIEFEYKANKYVAGFLFNFISTIASDMWPENVNSQLRNSSRFDI
jgi:hypothetical protein